jgi:hypothetical protein
MDPHQQQLGSQQEEAIPETQLGAPSSEEPSGSQQHSAAEVQASPALSILSDVFAEVRPAGVVELNNALLSSCCRMQHTYAGQQRVCATNSLDAERWRVLLQVSNTFNSDLAVKAKAIDEVSPSAQTAALLQPGVNHGA